jgi:hypothetical protein
MSVLWSEASKQKNKNKKMSPLQSALWSAFWTSNHARYLSATLRHCDLRLAMMACIRGRAFTAEWNLTVWLSVEPDCVAQRVPQR